MKIYNTLTKKKEVFKPISRRTGWHVYMWTYSLSLCTYWKSS